jgi:enoyl-CoA hydratase
MSLVLRQDRDGVATLLLNRPEKLNALSPEMLSALRGHLDAVGNDDAVGCVVLGGMGRSFCAGHDLSSIASGEHGPGRHFEAETVDLLEQLPQPTIARLHGHCFTGGLELALACDLLVAAASTVLGDTHGQWGLVPVWGLSVRLPERIGVQAAKALMFTSRRITAATALDIGLVTEVVDDDELEAHVEKLSGEITANSAGTNRMVKALLGAESGMSRQGALIFERSRPYGLPADREERLARR